MTHDPQKKKEKKKAFQRCYYFFSRTSLLVLMNGYLCCNVCVCSVIDSWMATSPSSRAFPFHWLLCQCVCITQTQTHTCYADTWGAGGWGQHRGSPIRPSWKKPNKTHTNKTAPHTRSCILKCRHVCVICIWLNVFESINMCLCVAVCFVYVNGQPQGKMH